MSAYFKDVDPEGLDLIAVLRAPTIWPGASDWTSATVVFRMNERPTALRRALDGRYVIRADASPTAGDLLGVTLK